MPHRFSSNKGKHTVVIVAISSDIGTVLGQSFLNDGYNVIGTYRTKRHLAPVFSSPQCHVFPCDLTSNKSIDTFVGKVTELNLPWDIFISCVGEPQPMTPFFQTDFDAWNTSLYINATQQLRILHRLYLLRNKKGRSTVLFFTAAGVQGSVVNFSAYTISKIMLIKMAEFLDSENSDMNIFTVSPGWTKTKIHRRILSNLTISSDKREETADFLLHKKGTDIQYINRCVRWLCNQGKDITSGRNFSLTHDQLNENCRKVLARQLKNDPSMYKLRRYKNDSRIQ